MAKKALREILKTPKPKTPINRNLFKGNSFLGYEKFYVNGTSHSKGGGLETPYQREDSIREIYTKIYDDVCDPYIDRDSLNFAKRLSNTIKIPFDNEAECGGGAQRMVRMTYEWIYHHWDIRDKIFIILENPDYPRIDAYYKPHKCYYIINADPVHDDFERATRCYWRPENKQSDEYMQTYWRLYYHTHVNLIEEIKKNNNATIGLYSFCQQQGIKIFFMRDFLTPPWQGLINNEDIIRFTETDGTEITGDISQWSTLKKQTIADELKNYSDDGHPGYFGHIMYAEELEKWLKKRLNVGSSK